MGTFLFRMGKRMGKAFKRWSWKCFLPFVHFTNNSAYQRAKDSVPDALEPPQQAMSLDLDVMNLESPWHVGFQPPFTS